MSKVIISKVIISRVIISKVNIVIVSSLVSAVHFSPGLVHDGVAGACPSGASIIAFASLQNSISNIRRG
jgi:hypothetical protein